MEEEWIGFELHPETPKNGVLINDILPGVDLETMQRSLNEHGSRYNIYFSPKEFIPNTRLALEASEFARKNNKLTTFHDHIFKAYFSEGRDIGNISVLLDIAGEIGLDKSNLELALNNHVYSSKVEGYRELAQELFITSIPTFIISDSYRIVGAQSYQKFKNTLEEILKAKHT